MKKPIKLLDKFDYVALGIGLFGICVLIAILVDSTR